MCPGNKSTCLVLVGKFRAVHTVCTLTLNKAKQQNKPEKKKKKKKKERERILKPSFAVLYLLSTN